MRRRRVADAATRRDAATRARNEGIARGRADDDRARAREDARRAREDARERTSARSRGSGREAKERRTTRAMGEGRTRGWRRGAALATALAMGLTLAVDAANSPFTAKLDLYNAISACVSSDATLATCVDGNNLAIGSWDVSGVDDMAQLFDAAHIHRQR